MEGHNSQITITTQLVQAHTTALTREDQTGGMQTSLRLPFSPLICLVYLNKNIKIYTNGRW